MPALKPADYTPTWMPLYPRDSVHGSRRRLPVGWICPDGHRHQTRRCDGGK